MKKPNLRIGTSGYQYDHWKGVFYPEGLSRSRWLQYYSERFDTVEINNTFYHLPPESSFLQWDEQAPESFLYSLKFSRYASHMKKLKDPRDPIGKFMRLARGLKNHLGPILVQLPPRWHVNPERLASFLDTAPSNQRWAVEFRDSTWFRDDVYSILKRHNAALCIHDMIENHPQTVTAEWVYIRFHGTSGHAGDYSARQLRGEAGKIREYLARGLDVYVYFNNDVHGYAIKNASTLRGLLS